jgi:leucyl aminopeptidase
MTLKLVDKPLIGINADIEVVFVIDKNIDHSWVESPAELSLLGFEGKPKQKLIMPSQKKLYISVGSFDHDDLRIGASDVLKTLKSTKFESLKIGFYQGSCATASLKAMVEGFILGEYEFDRYKSIKASNPIESITISTECYAQPTEPLDVEKLSKDLSDALIIAESVNLARDIVNTPPDDMTPLDFASFADEIADAENLDCIIHDERYLEQEKMGAFLAVGRASAHKPRLIHLIYAPKNPIATVALVGKGLCYDSGGLSLKPAEHMVTMKADKSGAAAVLAVMSALDRLGFPIEVHGVIGAAENMIGGNAYKPDDVLTAKNGKTIEIRNTDAEGRLVLADCLCYIQDYLAENNKKPNYILDFATLTGACVVALGEYTTGVMGHSDEAKERVLKAAKSSGELASTLPFNRYLSELMKSEIADLSNISSSRYGGAITAAIFLSNFISEENKEAWVHLDIAGPAYVEKSWGYNPHGASGAGVRLALKWLAHLSK